MSKSNLKNINYLSKTKNPYIFYTNSTYGNLIYKLKKSCSWTPAINNWLNRSIIGHNENCNIISLVNLTNRWHTYMLFKSTHTRYNPNLMISENETIEVCSKADYRYIDVDALARLEKLARINKKRKFFKKGLDVKTI